MSTRTRSWLIETTRDNFQTVHADDLRCIGNSLVFVKWDDGDFVVDLAFATGQWLTCTLSEYRE